MVCVAFSGHPRRESRRVKNKTNCRRRRLGSHNNFAFQMDAQRLSFIPICLRFGRFLPLARTLAFFGLVAQIASVLPSNVAAACRIAIGTSSLTQTRTRARAHTHTHTHTHTWRIAIATSPCFCALSLSLFLDIWLGAVLAGVILAMLWRRRLARDCRGFCLGASVFLLRLHPDKQKKKNVIRQAETKDLVHNHCNIHNVTDEMVSSSLWLCVYELIFS